MNLYLPLSFSLWRHRTCRKRSSTLPPLEPPPKLCCHSRCPRKSRKQRPVLLHHCENNEPQFQNSAFQFPTFPTNLVQQQLRSYTNEWQPQLFSPALHFHSSHILWVCVWSSGGGGVCVCPLSRCPHTPKSSVSWGGPTPSWSMKVREKQCGQGQIHSMCVTLVNVQPLQRIKHSFWPRTNTLCLTVKQLQNDDVEIIHRLCLLGFCQEVTLRQS